MATNSFENIHRDYGVPVEKGMHVRMGHRHGIVTAPSRTHGGYVCVRWFGMKKGEPVYPLDLDYWIEDEWKLGEDYCARRDARIERWNKMFIAWIKEE